MIKIFGVLLSSSSKIGLSSAILSMGILGNSESYAGIAPLLIA
jgi:hypothetical protein